RLSGLREWARRARGPVLFACLAGIASAAAFADDAPFTWPEGRKAAVSLAYDDALDSQLDIAIPALDRYGFKGSFYLTLSAEPVRLRMDDWRDRKSTRLNSSHVKISYAVFCLKKK